MTGRLLSLLHGRANSRGLALVREEVLLASLRATREDLSAALGELESAEEIEVLAPSPFLVIRLGKCSGKRRKPAEIAPSAYSYKLFNHDSDRNSYRPPEKEALLVEILATLGESDPDPFRPAVEKYSPEVIRKALDRVRRTKDIRKNPTALFRFLLVKLASNVHASK